MAVQNQTNDKSSITIEQRLSQSVSNAIFIPFEGFNVDKSVTTPTSSNTSSQNIASLDPESKLEKILEYLPKQQSVVRGQMINIILQHIEEVKASARKEMELLENSGDINFKKEEKEREKLERLEMEEMFRRIKHPARQGKAYEIQPNARFLDNFWRLPPKPRKDADGDIVMEGTCTSPRTAREIRDQLAEDMQNLVKCGLEKLEEYDEHCRSVMQPYETSMARRKAGAEVNHAISASKDMISPSSDLVSAPDVNTNGAVVSRLGIGADVARLSNGMPVSMERLPVRKIESLGKLTRRM
ncbi:putative powdery mildew-specific protein [Golovinomyces cichoracearum]|uniref:Putative powdery mildew-specific protein n=1 Tax=Golovinomyces cichoracearum TaxID=62708 RepID=A0A420I8X2_9PEZI|nr:putative powdery mildew-specific protein [Golovinomyces cichoracearum]